MDIGKIQIFSLTDGIIRLDGGAMFGVVPKVLWEKTNPSDEKNRITLSMNCLLIMAGGKNILVDTGIGDKYANRRKFVNTYGIERDAGLDGMLKSHGLAREDIDIVINTHLHFDHAGGNTTQTSEGKTVPTFPKARYIVQRGEFDAALNAGERMKASYLEENYVPVEDAGQWEFLNGSAEIVEGVSVEVTPGHTRHHQVVVVESEGKKGVYLGDLIPTVSHIPLPYNMAFDTHPLENIESKRIILDRAAQENEILIFEHDPFVKMGYCRKINNKYVFEKLL